MNCSMKKADKVLGIFETLCVPVFNKSRRF